ncbi:MAG: glycine cleavage system aminomethyltransferase GcvT, partial [Vallitaleaceae bacterium]|nr:glycine cleavage system aminomethyltransferase GcvT [Vallitaleaceae bacterium]
PEKYYTFVEKGMVADLACIVSRTGYTGEDGFEFYCNPGDAPRLWDTLLEAGNEFGLIPCGLGARDTLRLEAAMPLYGHEMNEEITPIEAGLSIFVKMNKTDFYGKEALIAKGIPNKKRVGLKMTGRGIAREQFPIFVGDKEIGYTTSGTHCPYLGYAIAMARVEVQFSEVGIEIEVDIRGRKISAQVISLPFYKK